jgi:2,5-furandicarboxylate decarboxylase 1
LARQALDLRTFLATRERSVACVDEPVDARHVLTALQHRLDAVARYPILLARRVRLADGAESPVPVVTNLTASRVLVAEALGLDDHRRAAEWFSGRSQRAVPPEVVPRSEAPVQEIVLDGDAADLGRLPVLTQHDLEPGPYLTAAHATTRDPVSGLDNTAIQRCWVQGPRRMTWFPYPSSHNARNLRKYHERNERCPVAFWIGHHPAVLMGTQAKLAYPQSHWQAAGGVLGAPLRIVPTVTHGERIMVPADAEIVIEGWAAPGRESADGPFGEYTGYLGPQVRAPVVDVTCISMRREAIYHDYDQGGGTVDRERPRARLRTPLPCLPPAAGAATRRGARCDHSRPGVPAVEDGDRRGRGHRHLRLRRGAVGGGDAGPVVAGFGFPRRAVDVDS